ncbi:MFS transporter [Nocardia sp. CDC153]|uniref:MFS transporter n=1 Tax=Nocardia sp. CDC153 TaxID=3112167 RepID=UPI002DBB2DDA|nr:MFS transporter [Nocardia sp. CDC153]MEC3958790.1 MFS transporter [Nocardia sp. CDC153]
MATSHQSVSPRAAAIAEPIPWVTISIVLTALFIAILDSFIVVVADPAIVADLHASDGDVQWVLAGYQLSYAVFIITATRLADLYGRKRIFLLGVAVFTLSSIACAVSPSAGILIAARVIQGFGAALMVPQVFAYVTVLVPAARRHSVYGVLGVVMGMATIGGQVIGGLLIGANLFDSGWRLVFWVNVPIGVVMFALALRYVPKTASAATRTLDLPGVLVLSAALFFLVLPLIQGQQAGWPTWIWLCFAASAIAFGVFVLIERNLERRGRDPLLPLTLFHQRSFSLGIVLVLALYALIYSYYLVLSVTMQQGLGLSALGAGLVYTPAATAFFIFSQVASRTIPRYGRRVLEIGAIIMALGYLSTAILLFSGPRITPLLVIPTLVLQSVGGGLVITPALNTVLSRVAPESAGVASGALSTAQQCGGALGVAVIGAIYFATYHPDSTDPAPASAHAFATASLATFVIAVVAGAVVFLLPKQPATQP